MINCYRDIWARRSHTLQSLTKLPSVCFKFKWTSVEQEGFEETKQIVAKETLQVYQNCNKNIVIHTDASDYKLGPVIIQKGRPIYFYGRKITSIHTRYTATEK